MPRWVLFVLTLMLVALHTRAHAAPIRSVSVSVPSSWTPPVQEPVVLDDFLVWIPQPGATAPGNFTVHLTLQRADVDPSPYLMDVGLRNVTEAVLEGLTLEIADTEFVWFDDWGHSSADYPGLEAEANKVIFSGGAIAPGYWQDATLGLQVAGDAPDGTVVSIEVSPHFVPEPTTAALLGLLAMGLWRRPQRLSNQESPLSGCL